MDVETFKAQPRFQITLKVGAEEPAFFEEVLQPESLVWRERTIPLERFAEQQAFFRCGAAPAAGVGSNRMASLFGSPEPLTKTPVMRQANPFGAAAQLVIRRDDVRRNPI